MKGARAANKPQGYFYIEKFEITRSSSPGQFRVKLTVRNLKAQYENQQEPTRGL